MKNLLNYILEGITSSKDFEIVMLKNSDNENYINFEIKASPEIIGQIIGKNGQTIRAIRNLLRVKATLEKKGVSISVSEA
jgi:predicted RNA-binding protein YlqC (UPF0109 family)